MVWCNVEKNTNVSFCETLYISLQSDMKIHLIKKQTIEDYIKNNARSKASFEIWFSILKRAQWIEPNDIVSTFNSVDILGRSSNRVIFNIGGNNYRMICRYHFGTINVHLFVKWIGTHAEYTKLCNDQKQYEESLFK